MQRFSSILVSLGLMIVFSTTLGVQRAHGQMDMLPQSFRDLPPEMQQGLPTNMTHEEYRQLTRNVDFFTMFMAAFLPGYALFQVERPELGWTVAGTRAIGAGLMGAATLRQYRDWRSVRELDFFSAPTPRRFRNNVLIFSSGLFINAVAWAADVGWAYRIANDDRNFVIYKYGLREGITSQGDEKDIEYIRSLIIQDYEDNQRLTEEIGDTLMRYLRDRPNGEYRAEVEYYLGSWHFRNDRPHRALLHLSRQLHFFPDSRFSSRSGQLASRIVQRERGRWPEDWELLLEMIESAPEPETDAGGTADWYAPGRVREYLDVFASLQHPELAELFAAEAFDLASREPDAPFVDTAFYRAGVSLRARGERERAIVAFTTVAAMYPDSEHWAESVLSVGDLLSEEPRDSKYARRFYERLVREAPETPEGERAGERLE
ncbi:MAG: tetratricopeptide repeat protein, partial [Spirochaetales bacterium]